MDYERFLSAEARRFASASLAGLINRFAGVPDIISLAGGLPPPESFPLVALEGTTRDGLSLRLGTDDKSVFVAQQYNFNPQGHDALLALLRGLTAAVHPGVPLAGGAAAAAAAPAGPQEGAAHGRAGDAAAGAAHGPRRDVVLTSGACHAISAAIACLTDPGDTLVVDEYTYTHALECIFLPRDLRLLPVRGDHLGMDPLHLQQQLEAAEAAAAAGSGVRRPRLLYCIPTGHNPTGAVMSEQRKRDILRLCSAHDMLVLEDDAYYWLHYPRQQQQQPDGAQQDGADRPAGQPAPARGSLGGLPRSMLSMDAEGRVVRIDTFSKLLGPGYRLGWLTAPAPLVAKLANWVMGSTVGPCSVSQVLVTRLLQEWGTAGFEAYMGRLQTLYAERAAAAHASAEKHLAGLAEWEHVEAGMFMWIKLTGIPDVSQVLDELVAARVVVVPGSMFATTGLKATLCLGPSGPGLSPCADGHVPSPYFRLSFVGSTPQTLDEGMSRLAGAVRAAQARAGQGA